MLVCAVAFSNLQRKYSLPAYVSGIMIDEDDESKLSAVKPKENFQPKGTHIQDPFDLTPIENEISKYRNLIKNEANVVSASPTKIAKTMLPEEILAAYNEIIDKLLHGDISSFGNVKEVRLHAMFDENPTSDNQTLLQFLLKEKSRTVIENEGSFSNGMQLARLSVWLRYISERRKQLSYIAEFFFRNPYNPLDQFIGLRWPNIDLDSYHNSSVGQPSAIIRNESLGWFVPLSLGSKVSMFPIARICIGRYDRVTNTHHCNSTNKYLKYGAIMPFAQGNLHCNRCMSGIDRLKLSSKSLSKIQIEKPLDDYVDHPHYIYLARFGETLKVGRTRLSRGTSRLLEQGCANALVFYPFLTFKQADDLEKLLVAYLSENLDSLLDFGIRKVSEKALVKSKIEMISDWRKDHHSVSNAKLYDQIIRLCWERENIEHVLSMVNYRILDCTANWILADEVDLSTYNLINEIPCMKIEGTIKGIIGSLIFLDNNLILGTKKLQGFVYRGKGFEPNNR